MTHYLGQSSDPRKKEKNDADDGGNNLHRTPKEIVQSNGRLDDGNSFMSSPEDGIEERDPRPAGPIYAAVLAWSIFFAALIVAGAAAYLWVPFLLVSCLGFWCIYKMFC